MQKISDLIQNKLFQAPPKKKNAVQELVDAYLTIRDLANRPREFYEKNGISYSRLCREAKVLLKVCKDDQSEAIRLVYDMNYKAQKGGFSWSISTIYKPDLKVKFSR